MPLKLAIIASARGASDRDRTARLFSFYCDTIAQASRNHLALIAKTCRSRQYNHRETVAKPSRSRRAIILKPSRRHFDPIPNLSDFDHQFMLQLHQTYREFTEKSSRGDRNVITESSRDHREIIAGSSRDHREIIARSSRDHREAIAGPSRDNRKIIAR